MSKVAIKGNASGTGTFTLEAPNSNTDRTLVLPDSAGTIATTNGITGASTFRITAGLTLTALTSTTLTSNWEEDDGTGYGGIGSPVSQSSGIFSFSDTGVYFVELICNFRKNGDDRLLEFDIEATENNSTYNVMSRAFGFLRQTSSATTYSNSQTSAIIDVTDVSNVKFRIVVESREGGTELMGDTDRNFTFVNVIRLGDT